MGEGGTAAATVAATIGGQEECMGEGVVEFKCCRSRLLTLPLLTVTAAAATVDANACCHPCHLEVVADNNGVLAPGVHGQHYVHPAIFELHFHGFLPKAILHFSHDGDALLCLEALQSIIHLTSIESTTTTPVERAMTTAEGPPTTMVESQVSAQPLWRRSTMTME